MECKQLLIRATRSVLLITSTAMASTTAQAGPYMYLGAGYAPDTFTGCVGCRYTNTATENYGIGWRFRMRSGWTVEAGLDHAGTLGGLNKEFFADDEDPGHGFNTYSLRIDKEFRQF